MTTYLALGFSCSRLATCVGACRSPWPGIQPPTALLGFLPHKASLIFSSPTAERAASEGKAVGKAPDIPGLHLPGGGRLPAEHGKPGCSDLEEAGDSGGRYWLSVLLSPLNSRVWWRVEVREQRYPRAVPEGTWATHHTFKPRENKENMWSPRR